MTTDPSTAVNGDEEKREMGYHGTHPEGVTCFIFPLCPYLVFTEVICQAGWLHDGCVYVCAHISVYVIL